MVYQFRFQDPSNTTTRYLFEEIVELLADDLTEYLEGVFAFASARAVADLSQDIAFKAFLARGGNVRLLVGLDAITDRRTLELLLEAQALYGSQFEARVYKNEQSGLFHPKIVRSSRSDGSGVILVGSGNLTPGGFRTNIEAYSVYQFGAPAATEISEWDAFLDNHDAEIGPIDDAALSIGERNGARARIARRLAGRLVRAGLPVRPSEDGEDPVRTEAVPPLATDRVLVAEVPRAGSRWRQVHFNEEIVRTFFRARPNTADRVFLYRYDAGGLVAEPPRPVVFPPSNVNHRIEFGARPGASYPASGRPIVVVREVGVRIHVYELLFPSDAGHAEMDTFLGARPSVGNGLRRVVASHADVKAAWPGLPI